MKKPIKIIIDSSSIFKKCLYAGKDTEFGFEVVGEDGRKEWVNTAEFAFENLANSIKATLDSWNAAPMDCIFVMESNGNALRRAIYPEYKVRKDKPKEWLAEYDKLIELTKAVFLNLGSSFVVQPGVEADDVVAYLAKNLPGQRVVVMDDADAAILHNGKDVVLRYRGEDLAEGANPLGPWDARYNRLYKALVGDKSDTLPGASGYGDKAWTDTWQMCGDEGMAGLMKLVELNKIDDLAEDAKAFKPFQKIVDNKETVFKCWKCAGFFDYMVNTSRKPLTWEVGMTLDKDRNGKPFDERLAPWGQKRRLIHSGNFQALMESGVWAQLAASPYVALDVETSTSQESDDWLRLVKNLDEDDAIEAVDVIDSQLTGLGLTFGDNGQYTLYFTIDHVTDRNLSKEQVYRFISRLVKQHPDLKINIHNTAFELPVLLLNWLDWCLDDESFDQGFLPNVDDTLFQASYVDENVPRGLKYRAQTVLGYEQTTYDEVVTDPDTGRRRKMRELTPEQVFDYGTDDTIVTWALRNYFGTVMALEKTWEVYREVEIDAAYLVALSIAEGTEFSKEEMRKQSDADDKVYDDAWVILRAYLIEHGWEGVHPPAVDLATPASIKEIVNVSLGIEFKSQVRTPAKLFDLIDELPHDDAPTLAMLMRSGDVAGVEGFIKARFSGEPVINLDSPKQVSDLFYETMKLPVRSRNKPTEAMRKAGLREGTPSTNALAIASAKFYDKETHAALMPILDAIHTMRAVATRRKLYYRPYQYLKHWKTGRIHPSHGQCATLTRRFAPNSPNLAQLAKGEKGDFRRGFRPHKKGAVMVSLDFKAQELRVIADYSKDQAMVSCYVGDNKRDMHHLTALGITKKKIAEAVEMTYDEFAYIIDHSDHPLNKTLKGIRKSAKVVNFSSEYGAQGPKMAETLMVPLEEAESYLEAKHSTFWRAEQWKQDEVIPEARNLGYQTTKLGARRHLGASYFGADKWMGRKADRQAVNFKIQGSCAEMTKLTMGRVWRSGMMSRYDATFFGPIHDELVFSVMADQLVEFVQELHAYMVVQYADMEIPLESSIGIGLNFLDLDEIGEDPAAEKITGALDRLRTECPSWFQGVEWSQPEAALA